jgi:hypothetical protein
MHTEAEQMHIQTEADRHRQNQTGAEQKIDAMQLLVSDISGPSTTL